MAESDFQDVAVKIEWKFCFETFWIMAGSHLQECGSQDRVKNLLRIYWIMSKRLFPWLFLQDREYKILKFLNYEFIRIIMLSQQKRRLTTGNCSPPIRRFGLR